MWIDVSIALLPSLNPAEEDCNADTTNWTRRERHWRKSHLYVLIRNFKTSTHLGRSASLKPVRSGGKTTLKTSPTWRRASILWSIQSNFHLELFRTWMKQSQTQQKKTSSNTCPKSHSCAVHVDSPNQTGGSPFQRPTVNPQVRVNSRPFKWLKLFNQTNSWILHLKSGVASHPPRHH